MNSLQPLRPLKWYKALGEQKTRIAERAFLVEGERSVSQIITGFPDEVLEILVTDDLTKSYPDYPRRILTGVQFKSISSVKTPQGIIAVVRLPQNIYSDNLPCNAGRRILFLEDIQDPGNAGTLIRTAAAFDFSGIIMTEKCADPFSPKCVQSTAGTLLSLWLRRTRSYNELIDSLKGSGFKLVATDLRGSEYPSELKKLNSFILALGNEAAGLSKSIIEKADYKIRIPINSSKAESLNVAATGAICMYLSSPG